MRALSHALTHVTRSTCTHHVLLPWHLDWRSHFKPTAKFHYLLKSVFLPQVMCPTRSSTARLLMTRRTWASLKLRIVSKPCPTTSHFYLQPKTERKASRRHRKRLGRRTTSCSAGLTTVSAERSQIFHSERESLMSSSSQDPIGTLKPVAVSSSQSRLNQDTFPERDQPVDVVYGKINLFSDSPTRQMLRNLFLMGIEITCSLKRDRIL